MAHDTDPLDDIPSLVPERDELVSHRKQKRGTSAASTAYAPGGYASAPVAARTNGFVVFLLTILFFGMCAGAAGGYYFYKEGMVAKDGLERALGRITQLETRLNLVDEASVQSSTGLLERVDFNFSEIDKLWAARNQLRTEVGELKTAVTAVQQTSKSMETAIGNHANMLNESRDAVTALQNRIEQINKNFAGMDNLGGQLTLLNADLNRVKTAMEQVQADVSSRLSATEQDIESINVFRLQLNQNLATLQDSVNRLQQRVGQ